MSFLDSVDTTAHISAPMARRFLARLGLSARVCGNCSSFSLEEGARIMRERHPVFHAVTQHVTPAMMMRAKQIENAAKAEEARKEAEAAAEAADPVLAAERAAKKIVDEEVAALRGEAPPSPPKPDVPALPPEMDDVKWADFGRCKTHQRIDHISNTCNRWG